MKIVRIEREISHKIYVGEYETISPTLRMVAELEDVDTTKDAQKILDKAITPKWSKVALYEIRMVMKRRKIVPVENDKTPQLMEVFKAQLSG